VCQEQIAAEVNHSALVTADRAVASREVRVIAALPRKLRGGRRPGLGLSLESSAVARLGKR